MCEGIRYIIRYNDGEITDRSPIIPKGEYHALIRSLEDRFVRLQKELERLQDRVAALELKEMQKNPVIFWNIEGYMRDSGKGGGIE